MVVVICGVFVIIVLVMRFFVYFVFLMRKVCWNSRLSIYMDETIRGSTR